jgi:hypothetical protein
MSKAKIIVIGGLYRSGSVWQFNVVKHALRLSGYTTGQGGNPKEDPQSFEHSINNNDFHIIKIHRYRSEISDISDYIFTSSRSLDEVRDSMFRLKGVRYSRKELRRFYENFKMWDELSNYSMSFYNLLNYKADVVKDILGVLNLDLDPEVVIDVVKRIEPPTDKKQDPESMYFMNHISEKYK